MVLSGGFADIGYILLTGQVNCIRPTLFERALDCEILVRTATRFLK